MQGVKHDYLQKIKVQWRFKNQDIRTGLLYISSNAIVMKSELYLSMREYLSRATESPKIEILKDGKPWLNIAVSDYAIQIKNLKQLTDGISHVSKKDLKEKLALTEFKLMQRRGDSTQIAYQMKTQKKRVLDIQNELYRLKNENASLKIKVTNLEKQIANKWIGWPNE